MDCFERESLSHECLLFTLKESTPRLQHSGTLILHLLVNGTRSGIGSFLVTLKAGRYQLSFPFGCNLSEFRGSMSC